MNLKVSVILLCNGDKSVLEKCLDTILVQTHQNLEVICVTNPQRKLDLLKYSEKDERVKILENNPLEAHLWCPAAIQKATGEFVIFLDEKCCLNPKAIERMVETADKNNSEIVISEFYTELTRPLKKVCHFAPHFSHQKEPFSISNQRNLFDLMMPGLINKLIRLDLLKKYNISLGGQRGYLNCISFLFLCLSYAKRISILNEYLLYGQNQMVPRPSNLKDFWPFLIHEINCLNSHLETRNLKDKFRLYTDISTYFLSRILRIVGPEICSRLYLIREKLSPSAFNRIFRSNSRRGYIATKDVSIIIPVYNAEKYLRRCLDSVCGQTLDDIEIICVDDGSTDNSLKILKEYEEKDKRITVLHQENKGQSIARNQGLRISAGEYVWFVDADDYLESNACETLFVYSKLLDLQMCPLIATRHYNNVVRKPSESVNYCLKELYGKVPKVYDKSHLGDKAFYLCKAPWATFYSRYFLLDYYIHFINKKLTYCEDVPFFVVCLLKAKRMGMMPLSLYHYCFTLEGSTVAYKCSFSQFKDLIYCFLYILNMLDKLGNRQLFTLFANSFIKTVLTDFKKGNLECKKTQEDIVFSFYSKLIYLYHYNLPKMYCNWCIEYLKGQPFKRLNFKFHIVYNKIRNNFFPKILNCQNVSPFKIKFCGLPIGHIQTKFVQREKVKKIIICGVTVLKIKEEL